MLKKITLLIFFSGCALGMQPDAHLIALRLDRVIIDRIDELEMSKEWWACVERMALGAFGGITLVMGAKKALGVPLSAIDMKEFLGAATIHQTVKGFTHERCELYDQSRADMRTMLSNFRDAVRRGNPALAETLDLQGPVDRKDLYEEWRYRSFLYGLVCGSAAHAGIKGIFGRENVQLNDGIIPAAITAVALVGVLASFDEERRHEHHE